MTKEQELYEILENAPFGFNARAGYLRIVLDVCESSFAVILRNCSDIWEEKGILHLVDWHRFSDEPDEKRLAELSFIYKGLGGKYRTHINRYEVLSDYYHSSEYIRHRSMIVSQTEPERIYEVNDTDECLIYKMTEWQISRLYGISDSMLDYLAESKTKRKGLYFDKTELTTEKINFTWTDEEVDLIKLGKKQKAIELKNRRLEEWKPLIS